MTTLLTRRHLLAAAASATWAKAQPLAQPYTVALRVAPPPNAPARRAYA